MSYSEKFSDEYIQSADTDLDIDEFEVKKNPIDQYISRKRQKNDEKTVNRKLRSLSELEAFLYHEFNEHICNASEKHIDAFNQHLKGERDRDKHYHIKHTSRGKHSDELGWIDDCGERHRHTHIVRCRVFYGWLKRRGVVSVNPAKGWLESAEDEFDLTPPDRKRIELHEMRDFVQWIDDPLPRAIVLTFLKTGVRLGELLNIDLSCLHIADASGETHPLYKSILNKYDVKLRSDIEHKPDTLYIYSNSDLKDKNRRRSNKRKKDEGTVIPLDNELKTALIEYLLARQHPKEGMDDIPLFTNTSESEYSRLTKSSLYALITARSGDSPDGVLKRYGWYEEGEDTENNVTVHYLRHYFSDNHKHNHGVHHDWMPIGVISYIRGDTDESALAEDIDSQSSALQENYSHSDWRNWKKHVREPYLNAIYKFNVYDEVIPAMGDR